MSVERRIYPDWDHEYDLRRRLARIFSNKPGGVFIDVGANVGVYSISLSPFFDKVYAIEPWYADQLKQNLKDYNVDNVVVIEAAAWDFNGQVLIGIVREDNWPVTGVPRVGEPGRLVKAVRLDDVIDEPFRLLKVDVEGEAMHVLMGMPKLLDKSKGMAIIEVHNHGESHGTYLYMTEHGWRLKETWNERSIGDKYHAHKVYVK